MRKSPIEEQTIRISDDYDLLWRYTATVQEYDVKNADGSKCRHAIFFPTDLEEQLAIFEVAHTTPKEIEAVIDLMDHIKHLTTDTPVLHYCFRTKRVYVAVGAKF